jgi:hypothetical protein
MQKKASWPRVIKFHGERYQVRLVSEEALAKDHGGKAPLADYDRDTSTIRVWRDLNHESRWRNLLHEILHLSFRIVHGRDGTDDDIEENLIEQIDQVLYQILSDNFGFGYKEVKRIWKNAKFGTRSGFMFDILTPDPTMVDIEEIAHCLSYECRYNGHIPGDNFLSVAEHSVAVCEKIQRDVESGSVNVALIALLHDAHEAYTGDIVAPLKRLLPEIKEIERGIQDVILVKYGISEVSDKSARVVKRVDEQVGEMERLIFANMREDEGTTGLLFLTPRKAKKLFMDKFKEVYVARTQTPD